MTTIHLEDTDRHAIAELLQLAAAVLTDLSEQTLHNPAAKETARRRAGRATELAAWFECAEVCAMQIPSEALEEN
jgi:hypothetical protein